MKPKQNNSVSVATTNTNLDAGKLIAGGVGLLMTLPYMLPEQAMLYYKLALNNSDKWGIIAVGGALVYVVFDIAFGK